MVFPDSIQVRALHYPDPLIQELNVLSRDMKKVHAVLFAFLMLTMSLAGFLVGDDFDSSKIDDKISDLEDIQEEMTETISNQNQTIEQLEQSSTGYTSWLAIVLGISGVLSGEPVENMAIASTMQGQECPADDFYINEDGESQTGCYGQHFLGPFTNLYGANLSDANMSGLWLFGSYMSKANLSGVTVSNTTVFQYANLKGANLGGVDLSNLPAWIPRSPSFMYVTATELEQCPALLPLYYQCENKNIVGPLMVLTGANLTGIDLTGVNLSYSIMRGADLSNSNMSGVTLSYTVLTGANLSGANLSHANLKAAELRHADLNGVDLFGADLSGADLTGANMRTTYMGGNSIDPMVMVPMTRAINLLGCPAALPTDWQCVGYFYSHAQAYALVGPHADLTEADLLGVDLAGLTMTDVMLYETNLSGANLTGTDLTASSFLSANLTGADLTGAILADTSWNNTICPDGTNSDNNGNTCENNLG